MALGKKWQQSGAVVIGALALVTAACGSDKSDGAASKSSGKDADMVTAIPSLSGVGTSVTIDAGTAAALTSLNVALAPSGTATFDAGTSTITFPITSGYAEIHQDVTYQPGYIAGSIQHQGSGFTLASGATKVELSNFVVDPGNSMLYGTVGGKPKIPLLFLDGTAVKVSTEGDNVVLQGTVAKLTETAAGALNAAFKTTAIKPGLPLGVVRLVAKGEAVTYNATTDKTTTISRLNGEGTSVKLDAGAAAALKSLNVSVAPTGSGTFDANTSTVTFPITGGFASIHSDPAFQPGYIAGVVLHEGSGLKFTAGAKSLELRDFVVDPGNSVLTATAGANSGVPILFLDGTAVTVTPTANGAVLDGTVAKLTATAADTLNKTFGVSAFKEGLALGTVHLVASAQPPG